MGFTKLSKLAPTGKSVVRHLILLLGEYDSGKSVFMLAAAQAIAKQSGKKYAVLIDADGKATEVLQVIREKRPPSLIDPDNVLVLNGPDAVNAERIRDALDVNMPSVVNDVACILLDTVTPILQPLVAKAMSDNDKGRNKNKSSAFKDKATQMRILLNAVNKWGVPVVYGAHYESYQFNGKTEYRKTVTPAELNRLGKYHNMTITVYNKDGVRRARVDAIGVRPEYQPGTINVADEKGWWDGVFEQIIEQAYNVPNDEAQRVANSDPAFFATQQVAIEWMMQQQKEDGSPVFNAPRHAENVYELVRKWVMDKYLPRWREKSVGREKQLKVFAQHLKNEVRARRKGESLVPKEYRAGGERDG